MSTTKGKLASKIHKALGVNTRFVEASPEQVLDTLDTLNDWMMSNNAIGRRLGWVSNGDAPADPKEESGIPDWSELGVTYSVAQLVAGYFEKPITPTIITGASNGMQTIVARTVANYRVPYPNRMPRGTGNNTLYGNKFYRQSDPIITFNDLLEDDSDSVITTDGPE